MLEKIKTALGEELAAQVEEKLGDIELGITNDGSLVSAEKHDGMKEQNKEDLKAAREDAETSAKKLKEISESTGDVEAIKKQAAEKSEEYETYKKSVETRETKRGKVEALTAMLRSDEYNADESTLSLLIEKVDYDKITVVGDKYIGVDDIAKGLKGSYSILFPKKELKGTKLIPGVEFDETNNPWMKKTFNLTQQGIITKKDPELAIKLAKAAGVK